jgi:hypothetical protein
MMTHFEMTDACNPHNRTEYNTFHSKVRLKSAAAQRTKLSRNIMSAKLGRTYALRRRTNRPTETS